MRICQDSLPNKTNNVAKLIRFARILLKNMSTIFFSRKISLNIRSELNSELRELLKILIQRKPHYFGTLQVGKTNFQDISVRALCQRA